MAKKSLFITWSNLSSTAYELLQENWGSEIKLSKTELMEHIRGKFGIICVPINILDKEVIEAAGSDLKVVSTHSVGLDHLDVKELKSRNIRIGYVPNVSVPAVAEYAIALLLTTSGRIVNAHNAIIRGDLIPNNEIVTSLTGSGLYKSTVAVVGCGRIGISIVRKLKSFDPKSILYYARGRKLEADKLGAEFQSLDFIMKESDFIIVSLAQTAQTKGIINRARIKSMKSNAILVNIARGGLIDENSLIEALQNGKIAGAGLDVFCEEPLPHDSPFMRISNVVLSPHVAYNTSECLNSMAELAALNVLAVLNGDKMPAEVLHTGDEREISRFEIDLWNREIRPTRDELKEHIKGKFGIICTPCSPTVDKEVIQAAGNDLKVVCTHSAGYDHLDVRELKSRNIRVGYVPDVSVPAVAEHAIALLLATSRRVVDAHNGLLKGKWKPDYKFPTSLTGSGLYKSTVAVIGCGRIGLSILRKLKPFDPKNILYYARDKKPEAEILGAEFQSLDFIMKESDFIIVALAQSAQTKGIINQTRINSMKSNAILVNIARGGLIDENALIDALKSKKIGGAGLDVFNEEPLPLDSPLMKMDNVVLTPHIAYRTHDSLDSMAELAALNVLAVLNGDEMPAEVL
ncbi:uncharacterized protein LOC135847189 isoform X2 [Planococcus citri]|uniref:uncharacterized protein LOC135847189 isoform X2 n=1 Tax=Planococcus citri TaxID=170843 RepID=UPI0031F8ED1F